MSKRSGSTAKNRPTLTDKFRGVEDKMSHVLDRTRPLSTMIGMAPGSFFGSTNEDVNIFLSECEKARRYNKWTGSDAVVRLAYFLEGNARYAFEAEVADRVAQRRRAVLRAVGVLADDDDGITTSDDDVSLSTPGSRPAAAGGAPEGTSVENNADEASRGTTAPRSADFSSVVHPTGESSAILAWKRVLENTRANLGNLTSQVQGYEAQAHAERLELASSTAELAQIEKAATEGGLDTDVLTEMDERRAVLLAAREAGLMRMMEVQAHADSLKPNLAALRAEELKVVHTLATAAATQAANDAQSARDEAKKRKAAASAATSAAATVEEESTEADDAAIAFPTYEEFSKWLREMFQREDVTHAYMSEFYGRKQQRGEKVQDFAYAVLRLSQRSGMSVSERERTSHFLDGLAPRMKKHIKRGWIADGTTSAEKWKWNTLLARARRLERDIPELSFGVTGRDQLDEDQMQGRRTVVGSVAAYADDAPENADAGAAMVVQPAKAARVVRAAAPAQQPPMADLVALMKQMMESCAPKATPAVCAQCGIMGHAAANCSSRVRAALKCYNCGEVGHLSRSCPQPPTQQTLMARANAAARGAASTVKCYACQQFGHYANDCPNRTTAAAGTAAAGAASGLRVCYNCNLPGHSARDCPATKSQQGNADRTQG